MSNTGADRRRGSRPSHAWCGWWEVRVLVLEGEQEDDLAVSRWVYGQPWGFSSCVCQVFLVSTGPLHSSGEILAAHVTEICWEEDSRAGLLGKLALTEVRNDALNCQKVFTTMLIHADCWYVPLGELWGEASGSGGHLTITQRRKNLNTPV